MSNPISMVILVSQYVDALDDLEAEVFRSRNSALKQDFKIFVELEETLFKRISAELQRIAHSDSLMEVREIADTMFGAVSEQEDWD